MRTHCRNGHELAIVGTKADGSCAECARVHVRRWKAAHPDKVREQNAAATAKWQRARRREAVLTYGDGSCAACGWRPDDVTVLELDHVDGDGAKHRAQLGLRGPGAGSAFIRRLRQEGWPTDPPLQTLCTPCHAAKTARERRQDAPPEPLASDVRALGG